MYFKYIYTHIFVHIYIFMDLYLWNRPGSMKRDLHLPKKTCLLVAYMTNIYEKRPIRMKRDLYLWKETYIYEIGSAYSKQTWAQRFTCTERNLCLWKVTYTRSTSMKIDVHLWKETYSCKKRPTSMKKDLLPCGERAWEGSREFIENTCLSACRYLTHAANHNKSLMLRFQFEGFSAGLFCMLLLVHLTFRTQVRDTRFTLQQISRANGSITGLFCRALLYGSLVHMTLLRIKTLQVSRA